MNKLTKDKKRRVRLSTEERRAQLLSLGVELFSVRGYEDLSIGEIAEAAGISKGLLYHYFPNKRSFYVATIRALTHEMMIDTMPYGPRERGDAVVRFRRGLVKYVEHTQQHARPYAFMVRAGMGVDPQVAQIAQQVRDAHLMRIMEDLKASPRDSVASTLLVGMLGNVEAATLYWAEHGGIEQELLVQTLTDQFAGLLQGPLSYLDRT